MTNTENAAPAAFYMTVTHTDGTVAEGICTEAQAARSLATATRRGYFVEVLPNGGANIVRHVPGKGRHTVRLAPVRKARKLTKTVRFDLYLIGVRHIATFDAETGRIKAGYFNSIPPAATANLRGQGLITLTGEIVTVSLSARLAMLAQDNRTPPWSYEPSAGELNDVCSIYLTATTRKAA